MVEQKKQKEYFGLIKFYNNENYLNDFINGVLYCNTPEYYRLSKREGVSDFNESCLLSFREGRSDEKVTVTFGGKEINGIKTLTMHPVNSHDMWLHCWTTLAVTEDRDELSKLVQDINRLRKEFGTNYIFMSMKQLNLFVEHLKILIKDKLYFGEIQYSDDTNLWSAFCKSNKYSYQREYRFAYGDCSSSPLDPSIICDKNGFIKFVTKNYCINIDGNTQDTIFYLDKDKCYSKVCL